MQEAEEGGVDEEGIQSRQPKAGEWEFLEQGGRHAVFRYLGADRLWKGSVIRFLKCIGRSPSEDREECESTIKWLNREMLPHVSGCIDVPVPTYVTEATARAFTKLCPGGEKLAPAADLLPDYTLCSVMVEIKPKKGVIFTTEAWTPEGVHLQGGDELRKSCCKHCMQQALKVDKGKIKAVGRYCPVQLFQGEREKALQDMFDAPQNSLTIRKEGVKTDPQSLSLSERASVIGQTMRALRSCKVLEKLLKLQRVTPLDIEALHRAAEMGTDRILYAPGVSEVCAAAAMREAAVAPPPRNVASPPVARRGLLSIPLRQAVEAYFISRSAQDCSIMVQLFGDGSPPVCRVIDLDCKPARKFDFWHAQDQSLTSAFRASLNRLRRTPGDTASSSSTAKVPCL